MLETFARWLLRKAAPETTRSTVMRPGQPTWSAWSYETYAREAYQGNPYVFAAISTMARACAGIVVAPMRLVQTGAGVEYAELDPRDPVVALCRKPSPLYAWPEWVERMIATYLMSGHMYAIGTGPESGPNAGKVQALHWVRPDVMKPIPGARLGELQGFEYSPGTGAPQRFGPADVFWMHSFAPLGEWDGLPTIAPVGRGVDTNNEAMKFNKALLENGGVPGTVLETAAELEPNEAEDLLRTFNLRHQGGANTGRTFIAAGGLKVNVVGMNPRDGAWPETIGLTARQIALVTGVPPECLGDGSQKTFSNYREARAALYTEGVLPLMDRFLGSLSQFLQYGYGPDLVLRYDRDDIEALQKDQTAERTSLAGSDFLTVNEKRAALGYEAVPGGDVILVRGGAVPLDGVTGEPDVDERVPAEPPKDDMDEDEGA